MGWRERDWAKWTDAERRAYLGGSSDPAISPAGRKGGIGVRAGVGWTILASTAALFAVGHFPKGHPLVPALHFKLSAKHEPSAPLERVQARSTRFVQMRGPATVRAGSVLTSHGSLDPGVSGPLLVQARWKPRKWKTLGGAYAKDGSYVVRYRLVKRGLVHVRISLPDKTFAIATIRVV